MPAIAPIVSGFLLLEGVTVGIAALVLYRKTKSRLQRCLRTSGEVIEVKVKDDIKTPVIRYTSSHGEVRIFESNYGSSSWKIHVGDLVDILFDPNDPGREEVAGFLPQWILTLLAGTTSAVSILAAPLVYFGMR